MKIRRHPMFRPSAGVMALVLLAVGCAPEPPQPPGLRAQNGKFYLAGKPYRGVGANYYDLFTRLAAKPQDESSLRGLEEIARAGVPFVRFNAGGFTEKDWQKYLENKETHFAQLDRVVRKAEELGIGLIPSLFWTDRLNKIAGERGEAWGDPKSKTIALMRDYTKEVVSRYKDSPAIWAWEFGNEWNLHADLPNAAQFRKEGEDERDDLKSSHLGSALQEFAAAVRDVDIHRPIITGHSHPRASAWHNTSEKSWKPDSEAQWRQIIIRDNGPVFDTIGIHIYGDTDLQKGVAAWATDWTHYLTTLRKLADERGFPIFIGEFGLAEGGTRTPEQVKERFREILAAMDAARVDIAAVWVYDLPAQNNTWNITFANDRSYMLQDVVEANRHWAATAR
jgi:hypothetical protein